MSNLSDFLNKKLSDPILTLNGTEGAAGQVPMSQGAGLPPQYSSLKTINGASLLGSGDIVASSGFTNVALITTSQTWTVPSGVSKAKVTVIGGGGGPESSAFYEGGWSGSVCIRYMTLEPGQTATVVIGSGGGVGSSGGTSSFTYGGVVLSAPGGPRGSSTSHQTPTGGHLNIPTAPGSTANLYASEGGAGGQTPGFGGGARGGYSQQGANAFFYGGGGSAHINSAIGSGFQGVVIVEY